jgi:mannose-6-phosphate isomerase-like protein (cupin superfamily)
MNEPTIVPPGTGELLGDSPARRVEILSDDAALHATWSRYGPRREGADLHVHRRHTDLFYVLEGELTVRLGPEGEELAAPAGTLTCMPPLVVHGFRNGTDAELRYLNFHAPGCDFVNYMRALRDGSTYVYDQEPPPEDGGRSTSDALIRTAEEGERISVLADVEHIRVLEARCEPDTPWDTHADGHADAYYVLDGGLVLTVGDWEVGACAGTWLQVPPGVPYTVAFPEPVRFLNLRTPSH